MSPDPVSTANQRFNELWGSLYPDEHSVRDSLVKTLLEMRRQLPADPGTRFDPTGLVYCTYGDAFAGQPGTPPPATAAPLDGLAAQIGRLERLGVRTLWILPLLRSPGRDQGYDISDYGEVDERFGGNAAFHRLLDRARNAGILVVFDVAINHTSSHHPWFRSARADRTSPFRTWYHWSDTDRRFSGARPVFEGMVDSCWTWSEEAGQYYFHRFYDFQPDLNYAEPAVTAAMIRVLASWAGAGVSGFRLDAAPMLWKAEGTSCESLPETHLVIRIFRAALDMLGRETVLLAEANIPADALREYFGAGDECHAAFHFPLLSLMWKAVYREDPRILVEAKFPAIPPGCSWVTFLRCHDDVALDLLPAPERQDLFSFLCRDPSWNFRDGRGVSGRLFELLGRDPDWMILAFSILFSLPGDARALLWRRDCVNEQRGVLPGKIARYRVPRFAFHAQGAVRRRARGARTGGCGQPRRKGAGRPAQDRGGAPERRWTCLCRAFSLFRGPGSCLRTPGSRPRAQGREQPLWRSRQRPGSAPWPSRMQVGAGGTEGALKPARPGDYLCAGRDSA